MPDSEKRTENFVVITPNAQQCFRDVERIEIHPCTYELRHGLVGGLNLDLIKNTIDGFMIDIFTKEDVVKRVGVNHYDSVYCKSFKIKKNVIYTS